jgi:photoactive yellow protein
MGNPEVNNVITFDAPELARVIEQLPVDAINRLPFGAIKLNSAGVVQFYSAREAELSGRGNRPVIGMEFFTRIAPCMNTPKFREPIEAAIARGKLDIEFTHIGDFSDRDRELAIRAQSASDGGIWLFLQRLDS